MIVPEYTPGDWYAVVSGGIVLLLAPSTPPEVVRDVWASAPERGGGLSGQLDALVRHGIGELHPFAAVDLTGGTVHTALRGDVEVEVVRGTRAEVLAAPDVVSWSERFVGAADEVTIRVSGGTRGGALPVVSGVVRASRVRVRLTGSGATGTAEAGDAAARPVVAPVVPSTVVAVMPDVVDEAEETAVEVAGSSADAAVLGRRAEVGEEPAPESAREPAPDPVVAQWPTVPAPAPHTPVTPPAPALSAPALSTSAPPTSAPPTSALPTSAPPTPPTPALPGPASSDDHDGLTILSGELASIRQHLPSWAVSQTGEWPSGPVVPSPAPAPDAFASRGTASPATGTLPATAPATATVPATDPAPGAPTAGVPVVALSTGDRVPLDTVVLIGRSPQLSRAPEGAAPRLVTVPSPEQDISRTHAEVRLELGRVLVTDLYSTNGITVASGSLAPRRLTAGEAVAVAEGDLVDLGDGVTFTVEPGA